LTAAREDDIYRQLEPLNVIGSIHVVPCRESVEAEVDTLPKDERVENYPPSLGANMRQSPDGLTEIRRNGYFLHAMRKDFGEGFVRQ